MHTSCSEMLGLETAGEYHIPEVCLGKDRLHAASSMGNGSVANVSYKPNYGPTVKTQETGGRPSWGLMVRTVDIRKGVEHTEVAKVPAFRSWFHFTGEVTVI